jgi:hypothetical protein
MKALAQAGGAMPVAAPGAAAADATALAPVQAPAAAAAAVAAPAPAALVAAPAPAAMAAAPAPQQMMVPYAEQSAQAGTRAAMELELERGKLDLERERLKMQQQQMVQENETNKMRLDIERIKMGQIGGGQQQHQQQQMQAQAAEGSAGAVSPALLQQLQLASVGIEGRLTDINAKVEVLLEQTSKPKRGAAGAGGNLSRMYGGDDPFGGDLLIQTVQRLVEEHGDMSAGVVDKAGEVEELQQKIAELLDKNHEYVQTNNELLERRNAAMVDVGDQRDALKGAMLDKEKVDNELARITAELQEAQRLYNEAQLAIRASNQERESLSSKVNTAGVELEAALAAKEAELSKERARAADAAVAAADELAEQRTQRAAAEARAASLQAAQQESAFEAMGAEVSTRAVAKRLLGIDN